MTTVIKSKELIKMKILVIYSNHHAGNFNADLLDGIREHFVKKGDEVAIRDLYQQNFDPVLRTRDFEMISAGETPEDILKEQSFVKWADVMLFIYPIWWGGMPAIMKGYIDKVFAWGFAYKSNGNGVYPLLTGKRAMIINTLGQSRAEYEKGMFQAMDRINNEGIFGFCGIELISQNYFASIHSITDQQKRENIKQAIESLESVRNPVMSKHT